MRVVFRDMKGDAFTFQKFINLGFVAALKASLPNRPSDEDIARLARFLVSDDAAYITGQVINCNGGAVR